MIIMSRWGSGYFVTVTDYLTSSIVHPTDRAIDRNQFFYYLQELGCNWKHSVR